MSLSWILALFPHILVILAQDYLSCKTCNNTRGNYTTNSTYNTNLKFFLSTIKTTIQIDNKGFYKYESDQVYGIGLCWFNTSVSECRSCLVDAALRLPLECPNQKEAIGYYINTPSCMLRYSDHQDGSISRILTDYPTCPLTQNVDRKKYNQTLLKSLLGNLTEKTSRDSRHKFATASTNVNSSLQIHILTQCTPDLSSSDCLACLRYQITGLTSYFSAFIHGPSCSVKFESNKLYNLPVLGPSSNAPPGKGSGKKKVTWIIVLLIGLFMQLGILGLWFLQRQKGKTKKYITRNNMISCVDSLKFDYDSIKIATDNFSDANRLGKGTTTRVYKGMLPNGREVAVKRVIKSGKDSELAFNNEVLISANLQHRNLLILLGFCIEKEEMLLVFEFLQNESLDLFLYDPIKHAQLDWETRHKIVLQIARGLLYLQEDSQLRVIHPDIKPSNILLGVKMNPKNSNFSRATRVYADEARGSTSKIKGTYGYMPPEYALHGHSSVEYDVFSFGVLLLEIINGQTIRNFSDEDDEDTLLTFAWRKWTDGEAQDVVDKSIMQNDTSDEILKCIKIALLCVQEHPSTRPNMSTVVFFLNSNINTIPNPSTPGLIVGSDVFGYTELSNQQSLKEASMSNRFQTHQNLS